MKKININVIFPLMALGILTFVLSQSIFRMPPLGKFLNPFIGIVQNENEALAQKNETIIGKMGTIEPVSVYFDSRKVPHIYAANEEDLFFSQGFVTAYMRLWQIDFLSFASAGRLSEIFEDGFLGYDRNQRRIGILDAAKSSLAMMEKDPETYKVISAYTRGVNAYIGQLSYKTLPLEYKLLGYKPEPWTNLKSVLIMKYMANTLSGYEEDFSMSTLILTLGETTFNKLFPDFSPRITPEVTNPQPTSLTSFLPVKKPGYLDYGFLSGSAIVPDSTYNPHLGSNSWVVSGKKTKSGFPILCNDPHLGLSLPSIWLEMQLIAPGINVYGVSIPGTPAIIIGFNENIAWGSTNGMDDVKDWYKLKIKGNYEKYELDGQWKSLDYTIDTIKRRDQAPFYDTIYHTVFGPVVFDRTFLGQHPEFLNYALKWELHRPSNDILSFIDLDKARNYQDYKEALKHYMCPTQNFTFACKDNTIALIHQGAMAVKSSGQGKFVMDGTTSAQLHPGYIPEDSLPQVLNPSCNYLLSANQHPTSANYGYYYNGYYRENRANRIGELLENNNQFDIKEMEAMQLDNVNVFATDALPVLIKNTNVSKLTAEQKDVLRNLLSWKGTYNADDLNAQFFELWWTNIKDLTWDEFDMYSFQTKRPDDYILLNLIEKEPTNVFFDKQGTSMKETAQDIIAESFVSAFNKYCELKKEAGVKWGDFNKVNIMHLMKIKAFSCIGLISGGHPEAINASSGTWGPSWRMIVELSDQGPKAFGIYAGGQSGNVASAFYDDFVGDWNKGHYYPLNFYMSKEEAQKKAENTWIIR